jgi:hypothetical protein
MPLFYENIKRKEQADLLSQVQPAKESLPTNPHLSVSLLTRVTLNPLKSLLANSGVDQWVRDANSGSQNVKSDQKHGKIQVSSKGYDVVTGVTQGSIAALMVGVLCNPVDRANALYTRKSASYQSVFKQVLQNPFIGTGHAIKRNIPRNAMVFSALPIVRKELEEKGYTSATSQLMSGVPAGIIDALVMAKTTVVRIRQHTLNLDLKQASATVTMQDLRAAREWGVKRGVAYWMTFPITTDWCESILSPKELVKDEKPTHKNLIYLAAGGVAGGVAAALSYPLDVALRRNVIFPHVLPIKEMFENYCQHGFFNTVKNSTHRGFPISGARVVVSSAIINWAYHAAEAIWSPVLTK